MWIAAMSLIDRTDAATPLQAFLDERVLDLPDRLLDLLPVGVYVCDLAGYIVRYNRAAADLWGCSPDIGDPSVRYCGSYRLYHRDGTYVPHAKCPMADVLATGEGLRDQEIVIERPDGTRIVALVNIEPIKADSGRVVGAVNVFREKPEQDSGKLAAANIEQLLRDTEARYRNLAAIVESSDDAVLSKDLNSIIMSWNQGAERLFGYTAEEAIGKPVTMLIPTERHDEEPAILARIRNGERVDHYETIRQRKDGSLIDISLTISPVRNQEGKIVGASKIARDITERRRAEEQQHLLIREMDHRIKNLFAVASGMISMSARSARTPAELSSALRDRLMALAQAHALTLSVPSGGSRRREQSTTLHALIETILSPYDGRTDAGGARVTISGPDIPIADSSVTSFALLLHEFATNAAKYGALSNSTGHVDIACSEHDGEFALTWTERGGPRVDHHADGDGFGTLLAQATIKGQFAGEISRDWKPEGLTIRLTLARYRIAAE
jgi:PAS domain S-box-containing protein